MNPIFKKNLGMFFDILRDGFNLTPNFYLTEGIYEHSFKAHYFYEFD